MHMSYTFFNIHSDHFIDAERSKTPKNDHNRLVDLFLVVIVAVQKYRALVLPCNFRSILFPKLNPRTKATSCPSENVFMARRFSQIVA